MQGEHRRTMSAPIYVVGKLTNDELRGGFEWIDRTIGDSSYD